MAAITEKKVRDYVRDRSAMDNSSLPDVAWSPDDIRSAMEFAAREYNSLPPLMGRQVTPGTLPDNSNIFFDAITLGLLLSRRVNVGVNDIDFSVDGMSDSTEGSAAKHIDFLITVFTKRFNDAATAYKMQQSLRRGFRRLV